MGLIGILDLRTQKKHNLSFVCVLNNLRRKVLKRHSEEVDLRTELVEESSEPRMPLRTLEYDNVYHSLF